MSYFSFVLYLHNLLLAVTACVFGLEGGVGDLLSLSISICFQLCYITLLLFIFSSIPSFVQVAKFPFEEVPANKQGAKPEPCPSAAAPTAALSAPDSAAVLDTETNTGEFIDYIGCI